jgi:hypothetical protein
MRSTSQSRFTSHLRGEFHGAIQVREVREDVSHRWELLRGAHEGGQVIG